MFVSVALCTHNGARFLEAQVTSILDQSRAVDEIVVSDDASTDDSIRVIERTIGDHRRSSSATRDSAGPRFRLIRNAGVLGVTANFEQALLATTGDVVLLSDQDDVWGHDRVQKAVETFRANPSAELVASDARLVDAEGAPLGLDLLSTLGVGDATRERLGTANALEELVKRNLITGATMAVTRDLISRSTPIPSSWVHDEWFAIVAGARATIVVLPDTLIDYRQHGANAIGASELDLRGKLGRLRASRTGRNERLLRRARDLADRLPDAAGRSDLAELLLEKVGHEEARSALPARRLLRIVPVWREFITGRYGRFGRGAPDVLRDLVQPV